MTAGELFNHIRTWADERGLLEPGREARQMLKLTEEVGELAGAIARDNSSEIIDAIGDCVVVLTILASQCGVTIESCLSEAYEEIRERTGRTVDGVFIKD